MHIGACRFSHMHRAYIINAQSTNLQYTSSITSLPIYNNFNTSVVILLILNICDQIRLLLITKGYFTYHALNPLQIQTYLYGLVGKWISAIKCGNKLLAICGTNIPTAWGMHFQECVFSIRLPQDHVMDINCMYHIKYRPCTSAHHMM